MPIVTLIRMTEETIEALVKEAPYDKVELRNPSATITFGESPRLRVGANDCSLTIHAEKEEETECYVCNDADSGFVQIGPVKQKIFVQQDFEKASSHIADRTQEIDMLKDKRKARVYRYTFLSSSLFLVLLVLRKIAVVVMISGFYTHSV